ncbi:MAG TPA: type II toxin-antitoxin system VapC family toxin [Firmicutes bacterium]|jgi:predicted nucleic acid-binding protein|nr:type II toxin-antitoxin system VapC family toxin [Bacillota bacterium]
MNYFVDTSFWCALYNVKDINHHQASILWKKAASQPVKLFVSGYIFDGTITLVRMRIGHSHALELAESLLQSKVVNFLEADKEIREKAWQFFKKYAVQDFSFTDCSSFALMQLYGIKKVLAFDRHFINMNFIMNELYSFIRF